jgi:hypothetical protein
VSPPSPGASGSRLFSVAPVLPRRSVRGGRPPTCGASSAPCTRNWPRLSPDDTCWLADSVPVYACKFSRARYSRLFRGQAAYDHAQKQACYGFRLHTRISSEGVVRAFELVPANVSDRTALTAPDLPLGSQGVGDRNYWSPDLGDELASAGIRLYAPFSSKAKDRDRERSTALSRDRWLIETVQGQLAERYEVKRVRARDQPEVRVMAATCVGESDLADEPLNELAASTLVDALMSEARVVPTQVLAGHLVQVGRHLPADRAAGLLTQAARYLTSHLSAGTNPTTRAAQCPALAAACRALPPDRAVALLDAAVVAPASDSMVLPCYTGILADVGRGLPPGAADRLEQASRGLAAELIRRSNSTPHRRGDPTARKHNESLAGAQAEVCRVHPTGAVLSILMECVESYPAGLGEPALKSALVAVGKALPADKGAVVLDSMAGRLALNYRERLWDTGLSQTLAELYAAVPPEASSPPVTRHITALTAALAAEPASSFRRESYARNLVRFYRLHPTGGWGVSSC